MDGIDGLAFAAGMAKVAGTMMVFPSLRLMVVVEDGGNLVLWKVLAAVVWLSRRVTAGAGASRDSFHHLCQPVGDGLPVLEQRRAWLLLPCLVGRGCRWLWDQLPGRAEAARRLRGMWFQTLPGTLPGASR